MFSFHSLTLLSSSPKQTPEPEQKKPVSVHFNQEIEVQLIPDRKILQSYNLITQLWFQPDEYATIKKEAITEIRHFILDREMHGETITPREALHRLFQPQVLHVSSEEDTVEDIEENLHNCTWCDAPGISA